MHGPLRGILLPVTVQVELPCPVPWQALRKSAGSRLDREGLRLEKRNVQHPEAPHQPGRAEQISGSQNLETTRQGRAGPVHEAGRGGGEVPPSQLLLGGSCGFKRIRGKLQQRRDTRGGLARESRVGLQAWGRGQAAGSCSARLCFIPQVRNIPSTPHACLHKPATALQEKLLSLFLMQESLSGFWGL